MGLAVGEISGEVSRVDEDPFEKEIRLDNETSEEELRVSTTPRYVKPKELDQLEEWMKETPIPYISNDKFSQEGIFWYWSGSLSGHRMILLRKKTWIRPWKTH